MPHSGHCVHWLKTATIFPRTLGTVLKAPYRKCWPSHDFTN